MQRALDDCQTQLIRPKTFLFNLLIKPDVALTFEHTTNPMRFFMRDAKCRICNLLKRAQSGEEVDTAFCGQPVTLFLPLYRAGALVCPRGNGAELSAWLSSRALRAQQRDHEQIEGDIQDIKSSWY